jgi:hypothetical protein
LWSFERPENFQLANVTFNETEFDPTFEYGKKHAILELRKQPQDMGFGVENIS